MTPNQSVTAFVYRENQLLDEKRYDEWLALFDPEGMYWVPSAADQEDPIQQISITYEDPVLLEMRIGRLCHPNAHALARPIRTSRMVSNLQVNVADNLIQADARFVLYEWQGDELRQFAGSVRYLLSCSEPYRIHLKRVDLVNVEQAFESIQIIL